MRREWAWSETARSARRKDHDNGENKECRVDALACTRHDYIFECAMKNPTPATKNNSIVDTISAMEFYFLALKSLISVVFRVLFIL